MLRAVTVLVVGWLAVLFAGGPALAAPAGPETPSQAAYIAERLRDSPVHISDAIPREVPRSTAPDFAREARRLSVPTYVIVLPATSYPVHTDDLLAGVHDHLGRAGLYVALTESGMTGAQTYGVGLPGADDARTATIFELPYDATARESFRHYVDVLTSGRAAERASAARAGYGGDSRDDPPNLHTSQTDRKNQSFLTGIAITGIPISALVITVYLWQRHRVRAARTAAPPVPAPRGTPGKAGAKGSTKGYAKTGGPKGVGGKGGGAKRGGAKPSAGRGPGPFPGKWQVRLTAAALALSGLLALTASQVFDETTTGDGSVPTAADLRARVDRVAEGLRQDPLYVDPERDSGLDAAARAALRKRLRSLDVPVLIAAVHQNSDDESAGSPDLLAKSLHDRLHRDALFVLADPATGSIDLVNFDAPLDDGYLMSRPRDLSSTYSTDPALHSRLDRLIGYIAKSPPAKVDYHPHPPPAPDPARERKLPGLFTGDFTPGLFMGTLAAALLFGLVATACATGRAVRRRWGAPAGPGSGPATGGPQRAPEAPDRPSLSWLRRTARKDVDALTAALEPTASLPEESRRRAWECLDAAALLIDGDSDGRIDADATPAALACAIVLARAGRTALADPAAARHLCHLNPLHGAARKGRGPASGRRGGEQALPVCGACRSAPGAVLRLRATAGSGRAAPVPYPQLPGPLAAVGDGAGTDQLTSDVREYFGVH